MNKGKTEKKEQIIEIVKGIMALVSLFILFTIFSCAVAKFFVKFEIMQANIAYIIAFVSSFTMTILVFIYFISVAKKGKESKIFLWLRKNDYVIILGIIILSIIFISLTPVKIWEINETKDIISIQWVIFGISIAIFVLWHMLTLKYLDEKSEIITPTEGSNYREKYQKLNASIDLIGEVNTRLSTIVWLIINLLILIIATSIVYLMNKAESTLAQNIVIISFYFSTNTIFRLFLDILIPIFKRRQELNHKNNVREDELEEARLKSGIEKGVEEELKKNSQIDPLKKQAMLNEITKVVNFIYRIRNEAVSLQDKEEALRILKEEIEGDKEVTIKTLK